MSTLGTLQIETTNYCNGKCVFCPVPEMKRERGFMSMDLFKKIIDDAVDMQPDMVLPFLNGEPFIDKDIFDRIAYVNEKLPHAKVCLYSNGNLLDDEKARKLAALRIWAVNFSLNAVSNETRRDLMGLDLEPAYENVMRYRMLDPTVGLAASMILDPTYVTGYEAEEFKRFFSAKGINPRVFLPGNWAGKLRPSYNTRQVCCRPTTHMTVLWDGRVPLCCFDVEGEVIMGDLNTETIKGVWDGERFTHFRTKNAKGERKDLELCGNCTTI